ncbi:MAG: MATE family efflux transporter [Rhodospirillaceae bacterium]|nr:MATE family efflux transporter [Rhodospirillaceae bacterium]
MTDVAIEGAARSAWAAEARATLALAWPLALTNLAQAAIGTTDVLLIGRLGPEALAAASLGLNLYFALFVSAMGIALGASPLMAQALGHRRHAVREVRRTVRQGLWASALVALPIWLVLWHTEPILRLIGQQPALAAMAAAYVHTLQWALLPGLWFMVLRAFIGTVERPGAGLVVNVLAIGVNAALAWSLIFGRLGLPALGLVGAGIATVTANSFMVLALLGFILIDRRLRRFHLLGRLWRSDWRRLREILRVGLPISLALVFEVTVFNAAAFLMGLIGTEALAAHAVAIQVASITFMVPLGVAQAGTVRVGLAAGRGDPQGVARAGWVALATGTACMGTMALPMIAVPERITGLFLDAGDPAQAGAAALAAGFLLIAGLFQLADGTQVVSAGALRGLKDTRTPMLIAGLGYWGIGILLGVLLAFPLGLGGRGIWIGLASGLGVVAALMLRRWLRRERLGLVPGAPARRGGARLSAARCG